MTANKRFNHFIPVLFGSLLFLGFGGWAAAQVDDGLDDHFFDEPDNEDTDSTFGSDTETISANSAHTIEPILSDTDDGIQFNDTDDFADTDSFILPDPDMPCKLFQTDYVEILSDPAEWPQPGDRTYRFLWVRYEQDGVLEDRYSQCCQLISDITPRCISRVEIPPTQDNTRQIAFDQSTLYEHFIPFRPTRFIENYRHRLSVNVRANMSHNPKRRNGVWGLNADLTGSMPGNDIPEHTRQSYHLYPHTLALYGAWRWLPAIRNRKTDAELIGRHHIGINIQGGIIPLSNRYAVTFDDMPLYAFYGRSIAYAAAQTYRNQQPFTPGLLKRTGIDGHSRLGVAIESNNFFTLPIQNAHVLGLDMNARANLTGSSLPRESEITPIDYPIRFPDVIRPHNRSYYKEGLRIAPRANMGLLTKVDTLRLHVGYSGEFSLSPDQLILGAGRLENRQQSNTAFLDIHMHFLQFAFGYTHMKNQIEIVSTHQPIHTKHHAAHAYLAFHLFQILAKADQDLDRYRHAISIYAEYLYHRSDPEAMHILPVAAPSFTHAFQTGLISTFPLYPCRRQLAARPHGVKLDFIGDISLGAVPTEWNLSLLFGLRVAPY